MAEEIVLDIIEEIEGRNVQFKDVVSQLKGFDGERVVVPINSFGGSVMEGLAIYNTLRGLTSNKEVDVRIAAYAMSMGSAIAMAGTKVSMPENGYLMIHDPINMAYGNIEDHDKNLTLLKSIKEQLVDIYRRKSKKLTRDEISAMMTEETWLTAQEAKEYGFIDEVTDGVRLEAKFDPTNYKNVPKDLMGNSKKSKEDKMGNFWDSLLNKRGEINAEDTVVAGFLEKIQPGIEEAVSNGVTNEISKIKDNLKSIVDQSLNEVKAELESKIEDSKVELPENMLTQESLDELKNKIEEIENSKKDTEDKLADLLASRKKNEDGTYSIAFEDEGKALNAVNEDVLKALL